MRIGELARRTGVSERALRYYEEQGLLQPARTAGGYRVFTAADVERVRHVRLLLAAGLSTALIAEMLPCMVPAADVLAPGCPELVPYMNRERDRITASIEELTTARDLLDRMIAATPV
ncbi:MerR family transcriptional regulator [Actinokineospora enzanensis]|uniref:MerR family transcriptional regulator n=1 Tax=Actinokineospora enzanensis TaxID=155975 RepID=UPI00037744CD|nr:MerR family transcriptional regulator [Actinokineospora enzanensis]